MTKWICKVCGYVYEGDNAPEQCPVCKAPASQFEKVEEKKSKYAGTKTEKNSRLWQLAPCFFCNLF